MDHFEKVCAGLCNGLRVRQLGYMLGGGTTAAWANGMQAWGHSP